MPRGYALGRCWVARPNALCETCRWFVEDTHPEITTFGLDVGERCSSKQKYYHNMYPCKTPGRAGGGALSRTSHRNHIGGAEAAMSMLATAPNVPALTVAIASTQMARWLTQRRRLARLRPRW